MNGGETSVRMTAEERAQALCVEVWSTDPEKYGDEESFKRFLRSWHGWPAVLTAIRAAEDAAYERVAQRLENNGGKCAKYAASIARTFLIHRGPNDPVPESAGDA